MLFLIKRIKKDNGYPCHNKRAYKILCYGLEKPFRWVGSGDLPVHTPVVFSERSAAEERTKQLAIEQPERLFEIREEQRAWWEGGSEKLHTIPPQITIKES